jgi:hypothetical protein
MRKVIHLILLVPILTFSQNTENDSISVNLSTIFYHMDKHLVHSFTYNYGMNHLYAAAATYGMVKGGIDWEVYKFSEKNRAVAYAGFPSVLIGGMAPLAVPAILYLYVKSKKKDNVRLTAIALSQATILSLIITSGYKAFTARRPPEILDEKEKTDTDFSDDFKFGFMNRGIFHGWPSGHTSNAFAMAVTLIELYPENKSLKTYALLYAFFIGIGISTNIHWTSDFVAGALIGYSIGKSVGRGFNQLKNKRYKESVYHFYITPYGINFSYQF